MCVSNVLSCELGSNVFYRYCACENMAVPEEQEEEDKQIEYVNLADADQSGRDNNVCKNVRSMLVINIFSY